MGFKFVVLGLLLYLDIIRTTKVELFSKWKPEFGWEVECSWILFSNDSLQSVRLYNNDQQFMIYRPEKDGQRRSQMFHLPEDSLQVDCAQTADKGLLGTCVFTLEVYQPPKADFNYSCEVSGEGPMFRIDKKDITVPIFVPPSDALVHVVKSASSEQPPGRVTLNCTSSGLPAPNLQWAVGTLKVPHDFSGSTWNVTSKLWHVWSLLSYTPSSERLDVTCTPEISQSGHQVTGKTAMYNKANGIHVAVGSISLMSSLLVLLRRL